MRGIRSVQFNILLADALILIFCFIGVFNFTQKADLPFSTRNQNSKLIIEQIYSESTFFKEGDIVLNIMGFELKSKEEVEILLDGKTPGNDIKISILRSSEIITGSVKLINFYSLTYTLIAALVGIAFIAVAIFVRIKCSDLQLAWVLHWAFIFTGMIIMMTWGNYSTPNLGLGILTRTGFHAGYLFAPLFFLRFSLLFPSNPKISMRAWITPLHFIALSLFIMLSAVFLMYALNPELVLMRAYILIFDISSIFISLLIITAILIFIYTYSTTNVETDRKKQRWIILGFILGPFSYLIFWVIPTRLWNYSVLPEEAVLLLVAFVPVTFGIAIVRYRLMNIDLIYSRSIVYTAVISILLIIYALIVSAATKLMALPDSEIASIAAAVTIALLFQPAKSRIQKIVDMKFFRVQYDYRQALNIYNASIEDIHNEKDLVKKTLDLINNVIPVSKLGYLKFDDRQELLDLTEHNNFEEIYNKRINFHPNGNTLSARPISSADKLEPGIEYGEIDTEKLVGIGADLILNVFSSKYKMHGMLILGEKKSGTKFTAEDIDLLKTISLRLSLTLDRLKLQEEVIMEHLETERLEEMNRLKSFFVSSISHDLKTPLTSIRLFAERLKSMQNLSDEKISEYLNIIEGESDRLTRLINNVLDYSKIERGVQKYSFKEINLVDVVRTVVNNMKYQLNMNKFSVSESHQSEDMIILGDPDAVSEALINLLSNSIKYSDDKREIEISLERIDDHYSVSIKDYGRGIPKDDMNNIFDPFFRKKNFEKDKAGGAGLGLAIVKHIIDSHNGSIEVESEEGKGSKFSMLFPVRSN